MLVYEMFRICSMALLISVFAIRIDLSFTEKNARERRYHSPVFYPIYAPITIVVWLGLSLVIMRINTGVLSLEQIVIYLFNVMISVSLYLFLLIIAAPKLSKKVDPLVLAVIWVLPNLNYVFAGEAWHVNPQIVLRVPAWLIDRLDMIFIIWITGFAGILVWKAAEHLLYRNNLLKHATIIKDEHILNLWKKEKQELHKNMPEHVLVVSEFVSSPLTIGLFPSTSFVVLPKKEYTDEQLMLIFRHELIHISRYDGLTKFFIWFCIALNWFNPLIYSAMKQCSTHLEMCCDELVVYQEKDEVRKAYTELVLKESYDERGFTSCLSASAKVMKKRLMNVVNHHVKTSGFSVLIVFSLVSILFQSGIVFVNAQDKGRYVFHEAGIEEAQLVRVKIYGVKYNASSTESWKQEALEDVLCQMELFELVAGADDDYLGSNIEIIYRFGFGDSRIIRLCDSKQGMLVKWENQLYLCENESIETISSIFKKD